MRRLPVAASVAAVLVSATVLVAAPAAGASTARAGSGAQARCAQIERRLAEAPALLRRITDRIDELQSQLDAVRDPRRRARLAAVVEPRIERLQRLSEQIDRQVAAAERLCGPRTT